MGSKAKTMEHDEEVALALELIEAKVPKARVKEIFQGRIDPSILEDIATTDHYNRDAKQDDVDPNIKRLVDEMKAPDQLLDPLFKHLMKDPVALSSGYVFDRSSVVDSKNVLKFVRCPVSGKALDDSVITLASEKREIEHYKATRDRNVAEIARKMIASGDYDSFHLVLEGVENYTKTIGDNYLPLARELVAMWSGIREASCIMLLVDKVDPQSHARSNHTLVSSGGLQERAFRIIVSAEYFRDESFRRDSKSGIYLSLFNEHNLLVERSKLFDYRSEKDANHYQIFGKHDRIVTKSKPGYFYKLEAVSSSNGRLADANGLMCKIFPESSRKSSYRMVDMEGAEGIFMGSVDMKNRAHGQGVLDYDDGRRFSGKFHHGSIAEGVLYRGAHVVHTIRDGDWEELVDEVLVQKYGANCLVYDAVDNSRNNSKHQNDGYLNKSRLSYNNDRSLRSDYSSYKSKKSSFQPTDQRSFLHSIPVEGGASVLGNYGEKSLPAFQGSNRYVEDMDVYSSHGDRSSHYPPQSALPALQGKMKYIDDDFSAMQNRSHMDVDAHDRMKRRSVESITSFRRNHGEKGNSKFDYGGNEMFTSGNRTHHSDVPSENGAYRQRKTSSFESIASFRRNHGEKDSKFGGYGGDEMFTSGNRTHYSNAPRRSLSPPMPGTNRENGAYRQRRSFEELGDLNSIQIPRSHEENGTLHGNRVLDDHISVLSDNWSNRKAKLSSKGVIPAGRKDSSLGLTDERDSRFNSIMTAKKEIDDLSLHSGLMRVDEKNTSPAHKDEKSSKFDSPTFGRGDDDDFSLRSDAMHNVKNKARSTDDVPPLHSGATRGGLMDPSGPSNNRNLSSEGLSKSRMNRIGSEHDQSYERSDQSEIGSQRNRSNIHQSGMTSVMEGDRDDTRDVIGSLRSQSTMLVRPMLLMVDGIVQNVRGDGTFLKGGTLQDGVRCIYVSAEKYADIEGSTRLIMTLRDAKGVVIEKMDLFGKSTNAEYSPFRFIGDNEPIVSNAAPGLHYQLDYVVHGGYEDTITLAGLICKIIPASRAAPSYELPDPEGLPGRYIGAIDIDGNASGKGTFHYETGCTFVGQFKGGKFFEGAYYRGSEPLGTRSDGQWDKELNRSMIRDYSYDVNYFTNRVKTKSEVVVEAHQEEESTYSPFCC